MPRRRSDGSNNDWTRKGGEAFGRDIRDPIGLAIAAGFGENR